MSSIWPASSVGDQFEVQLGKMLDAERNEGVPRPYVGNRAVQWGRIDIEAAGLVPLTPTDLRRYRLRTGDLLVCEGGEVGRAAIWRDEISECYFQKALHRLRPRDGYDPRLMLAFLAYWSSNGGFVNYVTQTSIAHLPRDKFVQMALPVPQKREQRAIAEALTDCGDYIDVLERLIAKKSAVKEGMMQELLTGRTRLPGFTGKWKEETVGSFANVKAGGTPSTSVPRYWGGSVRWMNSGEVHQKQVHEVEGRISLEGMRESSAQLFPANTVLIALAGQGKTRGTAAIARVDLTTNQSLAGILPAPAYDSTFLYYNLDSRYNELRGASTGDGGRGGLNLKIINNLEVALPSVDEQRAVGQILLDVDAEIEALERRLESAREVKVGMMQELLTGRTRLPVEEEA